jgi:hypothetical protein
VLLANTELPLGEAVERLLPTYCQLLRALQVAGAPEVQLHEPILVTDKGAAAEVGVALPGGGNVEGWGDWWDAEEGDCVRTSCTSLFWCT